MAAAASPNPEFNLSHPAPKSALERACDCIADAFRPERQSREATILNGHRVKELVQSERYSFPEACRLLKLEKGTVAAAHRWLVEDNARMNATHDTEIFELVDGLGKLCVP